MTCQTALSLLDDFVDGELSQALAEEVSVHLEGCPRCRSEADETKSLKELLRQSEVRDPGRDYWPETSQLILARTVQSASAQEPHHTTADQLADQRNAFVRALLSLAASLVILVSAVVVGQSQKSTATLSSPDNPVLLTSSLAQRLDPDFQIVTHEERTRLAKGMLLMGPPGPFGRIAGLMELINLASPGFTEP